MAESKPKQLSDLSERGEGIVDLLIRFGLMTSSTLMRWYAHDCMTKDAARKALERLAADGWLSKHHFPNGEAYFVLSSAACNRLMLKRNSLALRQRPLIKRLLILVHFSLHLELRSITSTECRVSMPDVYRRGAANYYFYDSTTGYLGWICLDDGKQVARVRSKTVQTAAKKRTIETLREFARSGKFRLLLLTTTDSKRDQLLQLFAAQPLREVELDIHSVPECTPLLGL